MKSGLKSVVGVGDMGLSNDPDKTLITYALGSCLGVVAWDSHALAGGILHFMLPNSVVNPEKAAVNPAMFGDCGLPLFLQRLFQMGATRKHLTIKLAGGAEINGTDSFEIGKRNLLLAKRLLWKNALAVSAEAVGGRVSRTLRLQIGTGRVLLKDPQGEREL